jgi:hypothetical protein
MALTFSGGLSSAPGAWSNFSIIPFISVLSQFGQPVLEYTIQELVQFLGLLFIETPFYCLYT